MNAIPPVGLSSCQMTSPPAAGNTSEGMLRLADYCPQPQPVAFREFCASTTTVLPPARGDNPWSFVAASHRREQAGRRPRCRAA
ncbi:MAG: hypothetical protein ABSH20_26910 [Tepidisphaeraceae bacterium]|jgi:hypothetical protein